jgi:hypothetical protein
VKALTVQQPWAWAIVHGGKNIENRTQLWKYRGPLAIHAGQRWSERGSRDPNVCAAAIRVFPTPEPRHNEDVIRNWEENVRPAVKTMGAIIGVVDLADAHPAAGCCAPWGEDSYTEHGGGKRVDVVHLVLENVRPIDPIPCAGRLGLWTPTADIIEQLAGVSGD